MRLSDSMEHVSGRRYSICSKKQAHSAHGLQLEGTWQYLLGMLNHAECIAEITGLAGGSIHGPCKGERMGRFEGKAYAWHSVAQHGCSMAQHIMTWRGKTVCSSQTTSTA